MKTMTAPLPEPFRVIDGWLQAARKVPSPNHRSRPEGEAIDLLVLHCISLPAGQFGGEEVERFFTNRLDCDAHPTFDSIRDLQVSAHLFIRRTGEIIQFVSFDEAAWHAGQSCWGEREDCNRFSIGIELEGTDDQPFTTAQYGALHLATLAIMAAYPGIGLAQVCGHSDIAPGRKTDPGTGFDWHGYLGRLQASLVRP
jgi:AmpD protein